MSDLETVIAPLSNESPCGVSATYEPEYEALTAELRKTELLTPEPVDWEHVVEMAQRILSQKSKDLKIASYWCYGLFETEGYTGLANGLEAYVTLIERFWEAVFPEKRRMRARIAAVEWLTERLGKGFEKKKPTKHDVEHTRKILDRLSAIDEFLKEKLAESAPDVSSLLRSVRALGAELRQEATPKEAEPRRPQPAAPAGGTPVEITGEQDIPKALRQCQAITRNVARFLLEKKLEDPRPYRLNRVGTWMPIDDLPPHQGGITQVPPVAADRVQRIQACLGNKDFRSLIMEAEEGFSRAPFWLDAHRFTAQALEELGSTFRDAKATVVGEVGHFLGRLPGALDLKFKDGTAFVSEETRLWIQHEIQAAGSPGADAGADQEEGADQGEPWLEAERDARALMAKGKFEKAVSLFRDGGRRTASARERFCWWLTQARFCSEVGQEDVAVPQLERLDRESKRFRLSEWEPELSLEVVRTLLLCYVKLAGKSRKPSSVLVDKADALYARLCHMDLATALSVDMKPLGR